MAVSSKIKAVIKNEFIKEKRLSQAKSRLSLKMNLSRKNDNVFVKTIQQKTGTQLLFRHF